MDPVTLGLAAMGLIGSFAGGALGATSTENTNKTNLTIARENAALSRELNQSNVQLLRETNQQNLDLQQMAWARDDTAYSRKVADLKRAGLNPILAATGAGMANTAPVKLSAPQNDINAGRNDYVQKTNDLAVWSDFVSGITGNFVNIAKNIADIEFMRNYKMPKTSAETQLIKERSLETAIDRILKGQSVPYKKEYLDLINKSLKEKITSQSLENYRKGNLPTYGTRSEIRRDYYLNRLLDLSNSLFRGVKFVKKLD